MGAAVAWELLAGRLALLLQPFQELLLLLLLLLMMMMMMMVVGHGSLAVCEPVVGQNVHSRTRQQHYSARLNPTLRMSHTAGAFVASKPAVGALLNFELLA